MLTYVIERRDSETVRAPSSTLRIASAGSGTRVSNVFAPACERARPRRTSETRWPDAGLSNPKSEWTEF
eukprot:scaffold19375_cov32-Tisochrysis_lutea.AAC.1